MYTITLKIVSKWFIIANGHIHNNTEDGIKVVHDGKRLTTAGLLEAYDTPHINMPAVMSIDI